MPSEVAVDPLLHVLEAGNKAVLPHLAGVVSRRQAYPPLPPWGHYGDFGNVAKLIGKMSESVIS